MSRRIYPVRTVALAGCLSIATCAIALSASVYWLVSWPTTQDREQGVNISSQCIWTKWDSFGRRIVMRHSGEPRSFGPPESDRLTSVLEGMSPGEATVFAGWPIYLVAVSREGGMWCEGPANVRAIGLTWEAPELLSGVRVLWTRVVVLLVVSATLLLGLMFLRPWCRVRRGLCPACGYDWRGVSCCPECGHARRSRRRTTA